jgi:tungstate transport system substrate-binding protein
MDIMKDSIASLVLIILALVLAACSASDPSVLRLATTTSTYDSGLLDEIIPIFEQDYNVQVDILVVGTGQAIALGENGDVDVMLVHARAREEAFVTSGYGTQRIDVMYNDFILAGPVGDPADVRGTILATDALAVIAETSSSFASRGDDSGTHTRELQLWKRAGDQHTVGAEWYNALGQGMGATLQFANESGAYTLTDRGTFLALQESLPNLAIMVGGESIAENTDPMLLNPYGIIPVNPERHPQTAFETAQNFVDWLTSIEVQAHIAEFGVGEYGQPLFYPDSQTWRGSRE